MNNEANNDMDTDLDDDVINIDKYIKPIKINFDYTPIISFINMKGGCAKSTLSVLVSLALIQVGYSVAIVDSDPQSSAAGFAKAAKLNDLIAPPVFHVNGSTLHEDIEGIKENYDIVIVDGLAGLHNETRLTNASIIKASDLAIIPLMTSSYDRAATTIMIDQIKECDIYSTEPLKVRLIKTRIHTKRTKANSKLNDFIAKERYPAFKTEFLESAHYDQDEDEGATVMRLTNNNKFKQIVFSIADEILTTLEN